MTENELQKLTLASAVRMLADGRISAAELAADTLARIEWFNPEMRAFITTITTSSSVSRFAPLYGAPISVKDLYDMTGVRTTAGSKIFRSRPNPLKDASAVKQLRNSGAFIIGKTNLHEFAYGVTTINPHFGTARNPWDPERISGGSSGGSASAVAMSMGLGSLGTDTGGSIRIPAALCGIVGLKPTYGRVSMRGVIPLSWSLDHAGPMAKTVEDVAILLEIIAGIDPDDPYSARVKRDRYTDALTENIKGLRVGIPREYFWERLAAPVEAATRAAVRTLEKLGAELVDVSLPTTKFHRAVWLNIASPEVYSYHEPLLKEHRDKYGPDILARIEAGAALLSIDYVRAQRARNLIKEDCKRVFETVDVIATPTVPIPAPRIDEALKPWGDGPELAAAALGRFVRFFNIAGLPAISVPCGFTAEGLPIGLQIAGKAFDESTVLRVAHAYEQEARWFERRPPI